LAGSTALADALANHLDRDPQPSKGPFASDDFERLVDSGRSARSRDRNADGLSQFSQLQIALGLTGLFEGLLDGFQRPIRGRLERLEQRHERFEYDGA